LFQKLPYCVYRCVSNGMCGGSIAMHCPSSIYGPRAFIGSPGMRDAHWLGSRQGEEDVNARRCIHDQDAFMLTGSTFDSK
jgi:hypothetical protein